MRRSIFTARPLRSAALGQQHLQPRRTFATPSIKPTTPSQEQAHPIGAFYEAILNTPPPFAGKKPEAPPTSSSIASEPMQPNPPALAPTPAPASTPATAKRGRKPKESKSVAPSPPPLSSSSSPPPPAAAPSQDQEPPARSSQDPGSNDLDSPQARARIVFGSSLAGPAERAERLAAIRMRSRLVAGVLVPPRPDEPDNCCMSGCVDCVWDRYRDEMEAWAAAESEVERRLGAEGVGAAVGITGASMAAAEKDKGEPAAASLAVSMDDDGGGSSGNWQVGDVGTSPRKGLWDDELYKSVPVGIREFMKQEKRLKEKHLREGTVGG
ncbi:oxidoreductase-like protein [Podospora appendiculata]|uniref:Oxidoreductase-like protein n=1 Tax=Podospora appendiculata TaxID=314037 RepID=A0AAE0X0S1_9PEZI|nr:oxidoreductase-like protein [Podospora appendiculata]